MGREMYVPGASETYPLGEMEKLYRYANVAATMAQSGLTRADMMKWEPSKNVEIQTRAQRDAAFAAIVAAGEEIYPRPTHEKLENRLDATPEPVRPMYMMQMPAAQTKADLIYDKKK